MNKKERKIAKLSNKISKLRVTMDELSRELVEYSPELSVLITLINRTMLCSVESKDTMKIVIYSLIFMLNKIDLNKKNQLLHKLMLNELYGDTNES